MLNRRLFVWALPAFALLPCSCGGATGTPAGSSGGTGTSAETVPSTHVAGVPAQLEGFTGLPDTLAVHGTSNSGVFLDIVSDRFNSESIPQPAHYVIVVPADKTNLKVWIFDGNCEGLWDQNRLAYDAGDTLRGDGSAVQYRLTTAGKSGSTQVVALGESPRLVQGAGVTKVFALDDEWEALFDGPLPAGADALWVDGSHRYSLDVEYVVNGNNAINGYKVAVDGKIRMAPAPGTATVIGGFIGGVVDSRDMHFAFPGGNPGVTYAVSRDFYPNLLTPPASLNALCVDSSEFKPAVLHPAPNAFVNTYDGNFDIKIDLAPELGQTWANFVSNLILEEGDADDAHDVLPTTPAGTQNPGIPPDDGQPYPIGNPTRDSSGYRLPVAAAPSLAGSPWLEIVDPAGVVRVTVHDLSGNVVAAPASGSGAADGWEKVPIPSDYEFDPRNVTWTLRMHNLDARNTWFLRSNVKVPELADGAIGDRVWVDQAGVCNGIQDPVGVGPTAEHGVNGVSVSLFAQVGANLVLVPPPAGATWTNPQLTHDLVPPETFLDPSGAFGTAGSYLFDKLPAPGSGATYVVQVDASNFAAGGALFGYDRTHPATNSSTTTLSPANAFDRSLDFGYCKKDAPGSIGDRVWIDQLNVCNGVQDPVGVGPTAEHGVNGVSVSLFSQVGANLVLVAPPAGATWANPQLTHDLGAGQSFLSPTGSFGSPGFYLFDLLPAPAAGATYVVQVDASNFGVGGPLAGYDRTFPATSSGTTTLTQSKLDDRSLDFGYCKTITPQLGSIGDRVWADELNVCNGIQDPTAPGATAEHGVDGVSVSLFTQVGANLVLVAPPAGATWANPQLTHDLSAGQAFQSPAGAFGTAGYYLFDKLPATDPGVTYVVQVDASNFQPGGALAGYARTYPATSSTTTTLSQAKFTDFSVDFGFCKTESPGSIGDRVWIDQLNVCNGVQDPVGVGPNAEHGVNGVSVSLFAQVGANLVLVAPPAGATWTNPQLTHDLGAGQSFLSPTGVFGAAGFYLFDKLPAPAAGATYVVQVDASNFLPGGALVGYDRTFPATSTGTTTLSQSKLDDRSLDFGYCKTTTPQTGSIGDRVWADELNVCNGIQDPIGVGPTAEHGVNGVFVTLFTQSGGLLLPVVPPAGATWANPQMTHDLVPPQAFQSPAGAFGTAGYYLFDKLPAAEAGTTYVVQVDASSFLPGGALFGYARTYPASSSSTTTLSQSKLDDLSIDFGFCRREEPGSLGDRVWIDARHVCNGIQDPTGPGVDDEHGVNGVSVTLFAQVGAVLVPVVPPSGATWANPQLTHDLGAADAFQSPAGAFGAAGYYLFDKLPAPEGGATYVVQIDASNFLPGGPLEGYSRALPGTGTTTLSPSNLNDLSLDFGYCKKECECQSGKVHEFCVEASVWVGEACSSSSTLDVYVKLDRGCPECPAVTPSASTMVDLLTFSTDGPLSGEQHGRNGLITVKDVKTVDGYAKVLVCLDANCPYFPGLYFDGDIHLEVTVNGVGEAFCAPVDCHCLEAGGVFPCDWQPLWCGDLPDFHVWSFVPWECVPHVECKPPCQPPPCKPPPCDPPPTCDPAPACPPVVVENTKSSDRNRRR